MRARKVHTTKKFDKDVALAIRRKKDMKKLKAVIELLVMRHPLPAILRDHALRGEYNGLRDLHIEPDWILIYMVDEKDLRLIRTGTHSDLFR